MKGKSMKIIYINGYMGENSNKPQKLSQLLGTKVEHLKLLFDNNQINQEELANYFSQEANEIDFIIGSSTGAYIGRYYAFKYNIPLISLNPVVDIEKTFVEFHYDLKLSDEFKNVNNLSVSNLIFLNKDDELLDYKITLERFNKHAHIIVFDKGGHRFSNLEDTAQPIKDFINYNLNTDVYLT